VAQDQLDHVTDPKAMRYQKQGIECASKAQMIANLPEGHFGSRWMDREELIANPRTHLPPRVVGQVVLELDYVRARFARSVEQLTKVRRTCNSIPACAREAYNTLKRNDG
jgi:hypothetical protein